MEGSIGIGATEYVPEGGFLMQTTYFKASVMVQNHNARLVKLIYRSGGVSLDGNTWKGML